MLKRLIQAFAAPVLLSAIMLSGCVQSGKDISEDITPVTPLQPGIYTSPMDGKAVEITMTGSDYRVVDGSYRFFPVRGSDHFILQQTTTMEGVYAYLFASIHDDTLVIYDRTFGVTGGLAIVPAEFVGRVEAVGHNGYRMIDPSVTAEFLNRLGDPSNTNWSIMLVLSKVD